MGYENYEEMLALAPYSLGKEEKHRILSERLLALSKRHYQSCAEYKKTVDAFGIDLDRIDSYYELPLLPVRLFKELDLRSVPEDEVVKTVTSSGTTGQKASKIYLDRKTADYQQKTLVKIVSSFIGSARMPMLVIDCPSVIKNRAMFSARGAGILGFSVFGRDRAYALKDNMELDVGAVLAFLEKHKGEKLFLFGFTFIIWQHFYKELLRLRRGGVSLDLSEGILIHGGGWKKLEGEAVSREEFCHKLGQVCGIRNIHDYYGMAEQTGCIYMECECGHLHASIFSDVIVRRPEDFSVCGIGEKGIIQVVSAIPESYPGHSLLTEDEGVILGEDDCPCGRKGKYFSISGRLKHAEIRGCSDTYAVDDKESYLGEGPSDMEALGRVSVLLGDKITIRALDKVPPKVPFDNGVIDFLNDISRELMAGGSAKRYPELASLGFWLRKASLLSMKKRFLDREEAKVGRGIVFHIAPSNVPVNYAYSLFTGLLCGNANIVRLPSKDFPQVGLINGAIRKVLGDEKNASLRPYIHLVRYGRDKKVNDYFSSISDVRVVWGGDRTIAELRQSPMPPRATELLFADRYSLAVIDSDAYMASENKSRIIAGFYNDTYLSDQNACTSPRAVVWTGGRIQEAKGSFWAGLEGLAESRYPFQAIQGVDKLSLFCAAATRDSGLKAVAGGRNILWRIQASRLSPWLMDYRGNSGHFYEYDCGDILELRDFCNDTRCQTIGYVGDREMFRPLLESGIKGIDRVVPVGHTMDFDLIWDGYNLVEGLTRTLDYK